VVDVLRSLSEREVVSWWRRGGELSPTAAPFEWKRWRRVFLIREVGGEMPW